VAVQTLADIEAQLAKVNTAIDRVLLGGQSYSRTDFGFNRANLKDLMAMRSMLESQRNKMTTTGSTSVDDFSVGGNFGGDDFDNDGEDADG